MSDPLVPSTLASHLGHLEADLDDIVAMLTLHHDEGGDIHPEARAKAQHLRASLGDVVTALTEHHERLAMSTDDIWAALTVKHSSPASYGN